MDVRTSTSPAAGLLSSKTSISFVTMPMESVTTGFSLGRPAFFITSAYFLTKPLSM